MDVTLPDESYPRRALHVNAFLWKSPLLTWLAIIGDPVHTNVY
jgi:hypothetical protein